MQLPETKRISLSFSGGRTSAVMTKLLWNFLEKERPDIEKVVTFANTGQEHEQTLVFVNECDQYFNWDVHWLEAVFFPRQRKGPQATRTSFEKAKRDGSIFEEAIAKYGIFSRSHPQCTSRLKTGPMLSYLRHNIGWKSKTHWAAVGIRADEIDRISPCATKNQLFYPLAQLGWTKQMVWNETQTWPFDLKIPGDHFGNCTWCWKKSLRKLMTVARQDPNQFKVPAYLEKKYRHFKSSTKEGRVFFRGNRTTEDILAEAQSTDFREYSDQEIFDKWDAELDSGGSCGDSCEIGN